MHELLYQCMSGKIFFTDGNDEFDLKLNRKMSLFILISQKLFAFKRTKKGKNWTV